MSVKATNTVQNDTFEVKQNGVAPAENRRIRKILDTVKNRVSRIHNLLRRGSGEERAIVPLRSEETLTEPVVLRSQERVPQTFEELCKRYEGYVQYQKLMNRSEKEQISDLNFRAVALQKQLLSPTLKIMLAARPESDLHKKAANFALVVLHELKGVYDIMFNTELLKNATTSTLPGSCAERSDACGNMIDMIQEMKLLTQTNAEEPFLLANPNVLSEPTPQNQ